MNLGQIIKWFFLGSLLGLIVLFVAVTNDIVDMTESLLHIGTFSAVALIMIIVCVIIDFIIYYLNTKLLVKEKFLRLFVFSLSFLIVPPAAVYLILSLPGSFNMIM